jgi:hypothetical protein
MDTVQMPPRPQRKPRSTVTRTADGQHIETAAHLQAFKIWVDNDFNIIKTANDVGVAHMAIRRWIRWFKWEERAQQRNEAVAQEITTNNVEEVTEMLKGHFEAGSLLIDRGARYLIENGIDNPKDAIRAIEVGVRMQRQVQELPDWLQKTQGADTSTLLREASSLLEELERIRSNGGAIDVPASTSSLSDDGGAVIAGEIVGHQEGTEFTWDGAGRGDAAIVRAS